MENIYGFEVREEEFDSFMEEKDTKELFKIDETGTILLECDNSAIGDIDIPTGIEEIEEEAFDGCSGITSVRIPSGVKVIRKNAFAGCTGLSAVDLPGSITDIEEGAFSGCEQLNSINLPDGLKKISANCFSGTAFVHLDLPDSIEVIENGAFEGCTELVSIKLPSNLVTLKNAFENCVSLKKISFPERLDYIGCTFSGCHSLKKLIVPRLDIEPIDTDGNEIDYDYIVEEDLPLYGIPSDCELYINEDDYHCIADYPLFSEFENIKFLNEKIIETFSKL